MIKTGSDSDILTGSFSPILRSSSSGSGRGGGGHAHYTFLESGVAAGSGRGGRVSRREKFLLGVIFALTVLVAVLTAVVLCDKFAAKSSSSEVGNCWAFTSSVKVIRGSKSF